MSEARLRKEKRIHAITDSLRNMCGARGNRTSIVRHSRDSFWNMVTCKRCLRLRFKDERYLK